MGNVGPCQQYASTDFRLAFGGLVGTLESVHRRQRLRPADVQGVLLAFFNRTAALEAKATVEWAARRYAPLPVYVCGSGLESDPAAVHSFANFYAQCTRPLPPPVNTAFHDVARHLAVYEGALGKGDAFTIGAAPPPLSHAATAPGRLFIVRGALSKGNDRSGAEADSGWTALRLKKSWAFNPKSREYRHVQPGTPPNMIYGAFDPLWFATRDGHGVNVGNPQYPHGTPVRLSSALVRPMHGEDPARYIGPPLGRVLLGFEWAGFDLQQAMRSLYACFGFADEVLASRADIEKLLALLQPAE